MRVLVHFYSQLRDLAGRDHLEVNLPDQTTVNDLLEKLYQLTPALRSRDKSILIGAGVEFVDRGYAIKPGDEISIMPPVQGG